MLTVATIKHGEKSFFTSGHDYYWGWAKNLNPDLVRSNEIVAARQADQLAFYSGWKTIYLPLNVNQFNGDYRAWLKKWKPKYVMVDIYDFYQDLVKPPHASFYALLNDKAALLKVNYDESQADIDKEKNARNAWSKKIEYLMPPDNIFYQTNDIWYRGVSKKEAVFYVKNTPNAQLELLEGRVVVLPDGGHRLITMAFSNLSARTVKVTGDPFWDNFEGYPSALKVIDGEDVGFYISDDNWARGVARKMAAFIVPNTSSNKDMYQVGASVVLPTNQQRKIVKVEAGGERLTVYLTGQPINGDNVGAPIYFKVLH